MTLPPVLQSRVQNAPGRRIEPNKVKGRASILMTDAHSSIDCLNPPNRKIRGQAMSPEARPGSGL